MRGPFRALEEIAVKAFQFFSGSLFHFEAVGGCPRLSALGPNAFEEIFTREARVIFRGGFPEFKAFADNVFRGFGRRPDALCTEISARGTIIFEVVAPKLQIIGNDVFSSCGGPGLRGRIAILGVVADDLDTSVVVRESLAEDLSQFDGPVLLQIPTCSFSSVKNASRRLQLQAYCCDSAASCGAAVVQTFNGSVPFFADDCKAPGAVDPSHQPFCCDRASHCCGKIPGDVALTPDLIELGDLAISTATWYVHPLAQSGFPRHRCSLTTERSPLQTCEHSLCAPCAPLPLPSRIVLELHAHLRVRTLLSRYFPPFLAALPSKHSKTPTEFAWWGRFQR